VKPLLKWAGGKRWQVPHLLPLWAAHKHRRLVEPFCGGLAIALGFRPERAKLNDINVHLANFYRWVERDLQITIPMAYDKKLFYAHRTRFNQLTVAGEADSAEAASLFYYLNRTCYNGLCRFNNRGRFNAPFGRYTTINYRREFVECQSLFAAWDFTVGDFENVKIEPDDFIYADPPYDVEFTKYAQRDFTWRDQVRLAEWLARHVGPAVVSNQATPRIVELYSYHGFELQFLDEPRRISNNGDRTPARGVLAVKGIGGVHNDANEHRSDN
jgi:DNA adenine methylase